MNLDILKELSDSHEIVVNLYDDYCTIEISYMQDRCECSEEFDAPTYKEAFKMAEQWVVRRFNGDY